MKPTTFSQSRSNRDRLSKIGRGLAQCLTQCLTCWCLFPHAQAVEVERDSKAIISNESLISTSQEKVVKLYGAGGARGLESYQSGIIIDNSGHILTSWSTVLDVNKVRVVTFDGRRLDATMVDMDPQTELAILKVDDAGLVGFELSKSNTASVGQRVFAISNLFGIAAGNESCSAQKGVIMATTPLTTRRGKIKSLYQGRVYVLDVMTNNPGAAGGALIDLQGRLVGMIGKEIRDEQAGIWLNYALPMDVIKASVDRILSGNKSIQESDLKAVAEPHRIADLGMTLIPDVLAKTPPFIDQVRAGTAAMRSGMQTNDLILLLNDQRVDSRKSLEKMLSTINRADSFYLLVQRGQELIRIHVRP
jgi:S1-C subfamily serine protease